MDDGPLDQKAPDPATVADAVPKAEPLMAKANRPYVVFGRGYQPLTTLQPYRERGIASWYGRKFHGNRTSSGEVYDMFAMTAAHPTLPLPSYVRVTRVATNQSIIVRVNDRGPFLNNRVIDLSYTAANKLGYVDAGSAEVEIELIVEPRTYVAAASARVPAPVLAAAAAAAPVTPMAVVPPGTAVATPIAPITLAPKSVVATGEDKPADVVPAVTEERLTLETQIAAESPRPEPSVGSSPVAAKSAETAAARAAPGGIYLQLGAFAARENAQAAQARIKSQLSTLSVPIEIFADGALFKLQAGPYARRDDAASEAERIKEATGARPFTTTRPPAK
jgi:rare lipoprotein A